MQKMDSIPYSHPTSLNSFDAYSARYDETQLYLNNLPPVVDREPSTTNLHGGMNSTANSALNHESEFMPPASASTIIEPQPIVPAFSPENDEEGRVPKASHTPRRALSSLHAMFGINKKRNREFDESHRSSRVEAPFKYITSTSYSIWFLFSHVLTQKLRMSSGIRRGFRKWQPFKT